MYYLQQIDKRLLNIPIEILQYFKLHLYGYICIYIYIVYTLTFILTIFYIEYKLGQFCGEQTDCFLLRCFAHTKNLY